jgi:prepilin-type N-terminal cleavage/methylation domain-containing protein
MNGAPSALRRRLSPLGSEVGFTLIELLVVCALLGITSAMFAATFGTVVTRSSAVSAQNIMQTDVRASVNQLVSDVRDATTGTGTTPILTDAAGSISFYSPNRQTASINVCTNLRKVTYWLDGTTLKRQMTNVTSCDANGYPVDPGNTGPIEKIVAPIKSPLVGDPSAGGWAAGQIFKYCIQSPPDMTVDPTNSTSAELITWSCKAPRAGHPEDVKTVIVRIVTYANSGEQFNYGAVATLRWNAS